MRVSTTSDPEPPQIGDDFPISQLSQNPVWHVNLASSNIVITEDKVRLYLKSYTESATAKTEVYIWMGILITILLTLATASFHGFLGFSGAVWTAAFFIGAAVTLGLCSVAYRRSRGAPTIDDIIGQMTQESTARTTAAPQGAGTSTSSAISAKRAAVTTLEANPRRWYSIIKVLSTIINIIDTTPPDETLVIAMGENNIWAYCLTALADLDEQSNAGHQLQAKLVYRAILTACNAVPDAKVATEPKVLYRVTAVQAVINKMVEQAEQVVRQAQTAHKTVLHQ